MMESSAAVRLARWLTAESVVCGAIASVVQGVLRFDSAVGAGLRGSWSPARSARREERMSAFARESRILSVIETIATAPAAGGRESKVKHVLETVGANPAATFHFAGMALVVAVLTHIMLFAALGVSVGTLGWIVRIGVATAGFMTASQSRVLAAAWIDKTSRRRMESHS
jgi:hypothetical protein